MEKRSREAEAEEKCLGLKIVFRRLEKMKGKGKEKKEAIAAATLEFLITIWGKRIKITVSLASLGQATSAGINISIEVQNYSPLDSKLSEPKLRIFRVFNIFL